MQDSHWPKELLTTEKKDELLKWMIAGAGRAYRHFAAARRERAEEMFEEPLDYEDDYYPETIVRSEPKVGRNEPCPCGSGKKYKKCCGRPDL
jgi:preprotein translocase subunit SecA